MGHGWHDAGSIYHYDTTEPVRKGAMIVLRYAHDYLEDNPWHIVQVDNRIEEGGIICSPAWCGHVVYGPLTLASAQELRTRFPDATVCPDCDRQYHGYIEASWKEDRW